MMGHHSPMPLIIEFTAFSIFAYLLCKASCLSITVIVTFEFGMALDPKPSVSALRCS